jgi:hypothetical protein
MNVVISTEKVPEMKHIARIELLVHNVMDNKTKGCAWPLLIRPSFVTKPNTSFSPTTRSEPSTARIRLLRSRPSSLHRNP